MTALFDAVRRAGERLVAASSGRIAFDSTKALSRAEDMSLEPPGEWSANRHSRMVRCMDGWFAVSLARPDDRDLVPAWTGATFDDDPWEAIIDAAKSRSAGEMVAAALELHLPAARVGESKPLEIIELSHGAKGGGLVVDLSSLWAGPYCGALLAEAGYQVVKIESASRPDTTPAHLPCLDARLNGGKRRLQMPLDSPALRPTIADARILITSARPGALARLGLSEEELLGQNQNLLWIAITAHGWRGQAAMRVGFGDDCAAAGGLVQWRDGAPQFMGDALADPLTGIAAATLALEAIEQGRHGLVDVSLARTAASFAELLH